MASDEPTAVTSFFLLQSRLLDFDHRNRTYVPALAESWRVGPDGRTVDLILREGLTFSDGDPLTGEDVVFTLRAIYDERTGAAAFRDSLLISGEPIDAKAFDNRHVQLIFPRRVAAVENYLVNFAILPSHVLKEHLESGNLAKVWKIDSDPRSVVTSGPFVVQSATPGERITLARNPHYWKKDSSGIQLPYLDKLVLRIIEDPNNTLSKLLQ
ncbi:MAG: ABC transporter substrate-binding protein, partial [Acidobacteriota bacterium]